MSVGCPYSRVSHWPIAGHLFVITVQPAYFSSFIIPYGNYLFCATMSLFIFGYDDDNDRDDDGGDNLLNMPNPVGVGLIAYYSSSHWHHSRNFQPVSIITKTLHTTTQLTTPPHTIPHHTALSPSPYHITTVFTSPPKTRSHHNSESHHTALSPSPHHTALQHSSPHYTAPLSPAI